MTHKNSYDFVKEFIQERGCELLSNEYLGQETDLEIKFSCGHIDFRKFSKFKYGKNICSRCAGVKPYTYEQVKSFIEEHNYFLKDETYKSCKDYMTLFDKDGYLYYTNFDKFMNNIVNRGCDLRKFHIQNPYTIKNVELFLKLNYPSLHLMDGQIWAGNDSKLNFYDDQGYKYSIVFASVLCFENDEVHIGKFDISNIYTIDNIKNWISINKKQYRLVDGQKYLGKDSKLKFKCLKCPEEEFPFEVNFSSLLSKNGGCSYCNTTYIGNCNNLEYLYPEIAKEWDYNKNYPIIPSKISSGNDDKYYWICSDCGGSYLSATNKRTGNEPRGCPQCNESNMEKRIRKFLENKNIVFESQKRFYDCRDNQPLPFDFYIEELNLAIEAQGIQHYEPIAHFGGDDAFADRIRKDSIKKKYCFDNNIGLIEISYKDFKNIESILKTNLNLKSLEKEVNIG